MQQHGREVASVEAWVRKGVREGWCKPVPSHDSDRHRRRFKADLAMNCEDPYTVEVWGRYDRTCNQVKAIFVDVVTRCRKCQTCLDAKSRFWTARAMDEYERAPATYLMTYTLRPEMHYHFDARMHQPLYRGSKMIRDGVGPLRGLAPATLFRLRAREIGYDLTLMLKRMRKRAPFRYLLVAERHMANPSSEVFGRPHFHVLLHDVKSALVAPDEWQEHSGPCTQGCKHASGKMLLHRKPGELHDKAFVRNQWAHGFTNGQRCLTPLSAVYVCKYVSKDPMARVRASIGYGKEVPPSLATQIAVEDLISETQNEVKFSREELTPKELEVLSNPEVD